MLVAVIGLGGTGLAALMGAKAAGASKIIGIDLLKEKLDIAKQLGADEVYKADDPNLLENYTKYLALINNQRKRIYEVTEQEVKDEQKDEINPKYETLYLKIDLYLEKIALLEDKQRYELLDELIKKYGRDANIRNDENQKNIYSLFLNQL